MPRWAVCSRSLTHRSRRDDRFEAGGDQKVLFALRLRAGAAEPGLEVANAPIRLNPLIICFL